MKSAWHFSSRENKDLFTRRNQQMQEMPLLKLRLSHGGRGSTAFLLDTSRVVVLVKNWTSEKMEIKEEAWEGM